MEGNVALVESTGTILQQLYLLQSKRDNGMYVDPLLVPDPGLPNLAVGLDLQQALDRSAVHL